MASDPHDEEPQALSVADVLRSNLSDRNSVIDSSLPTVAFLAVYLASGSQLVPALLAAVGAGLLIAVVRAVRRESLRHIASGFVGVAVCALIAHRTGRAEDFFLPGLLLNVACAAGFAVSALVRRPLVGVGVKVMTGDDEWREHPALVRAVYLCTWIWAGVFGVRVAVQVPLYLAGAVGALGVAKLVLGFPLFLLGVAVTYRVLSAPLAQRREESAAAE